MAVEWSKDINFLGFFKRKALPTKDGYPSKTYINLIIPDEREEVGKRGIGVAVVALLVLLILGKFGVYDYFARVMAKTEEVTQQTEELSRYTLQLADYDKIQETYNSYEAVRMTSDAADIALVDVFGLVNDYVLPVAKITSFELTDNELTLHLYEISLDVVSDLVKKLSEQPNVTSVKVTTAARAEITARSEEADTNSVTIIMTLHSTAAETVENSASSSDTAASNS